MLALQDCVLLVRVWLGHGCTAPARARARTPRNAADLFARSSNAEHQGVDWAQHKLVCVPLDGERKKKKRVVVASDFPALPSDSSSLVKRHLDVALWEALKSVVTPHGGTLREAMQAAVMVPAAPVGLYLPDAESYELFAPLVDRLLKDLHGCTEYGGNNSASGDLAAVNLVGFAEAVACRVDVFRNLIGEPFVVRQNAEARAAVERKICAALAALTGDLAGCYYAFDSLPDDKRSALLARELIGPERDATLEAAGLRHAWPLSRGVFLAASNAFVVVVNEEDHVRISSQRPDGDVAAAFDLAQRLLAALAGTLDFAASPRLGALTSSPVHVGAGALATVHLSLGSHVWGQRAALRALADQFGVRIRRISFAKADAKPALLAVCNRTSLCFSTLDCASIVCCAARAIIQSCAAADQSPEPDAESAAAAGSAAALSPSESTE